MDDLGHDAGGARGRSGVLLGQIGVVLRHRDISACKSRIIKYNIQNANA